MTDVETLSERVRTVERAVTEGEHTLPAVDDLAELTERVETLEARIEELDDRTEELAGATQALRGYVGNVRSVNERVEQRADTALAATERLERRLDERTAEQFGPAAGADTPADSPEHTGAACSAPSAGDTAARTNGAEEPTDTTDFEIGGERRSTDGDDGATDPGVLERIRSLL